MGKEKKEIGKLLELLNQYIRETKKAELYDFYIKGDYIVCDFLSTVEDYGYVINSRIEMDYGDEILISKSFGFIEWLVENDKIDIDKMEEKSEYTFIKNSGGEHIIEDVIMLLSIQDEPIEFLISILKNV